MLTECGVFFQAPEIIGCNNIDHYEIWYRLESSVSDDWTKANTSGTSHTLDLDPADYDIRVVVINDDTLHNSAELSYKQRKSS